MGRDQRQGGTRHDVHERRRQQRSAFALAGLSVEGKRGQLAGVREEHDRNGNLTAMVAEERFDLAFPNALKERLKKVHVKRNSVIHVHGGQDGIRSNVVVVIFRDHQCIRGLPLPAAQTRKLAKTSFTHATIEIVPKAARDAVSGRMSTEKVLHLAETNPAAFACEAYDERGFRLTFWKPKAGHRHGDEKGGEVVWSTCDELAVLQWLFENDLEQLYEIRALTSRKLLPMRDGDRERELAIAAQMQMAFGIRMREIPESSYHRERLLKRFVMLCEGDGAAASTMLAETVLGRRVRGQLEQGTFAAEAFFVSERQGFGYALWNFPDARYVMRVDIRKHKAEILPIPVDQAGLEILRGMHDFLTNTDFLKVDAREFALMTRHAGAAV